MRIAIFGGTFDPIHSAHLAIASAAADAFHLDRVLFVTAGQPPHKAQPRTPYAHRHRMVELAVAGDPRFVPSRLEEARKSYSFETIHEVRAGLDPADELFFVIGADAFAEVGAWYRSAEVIRLVRFIVVARPGHTYAVPEGATVLRLDTLALPFSSSELRAKLARGCPATELPEPVARYIREHGLYTAAVQ
ncbi:MAG: nicotinate-nucleotide adenylyltransferase [Bryobacteraceae bacterium]|nr:nicotinate-nucleotide adenylyltransferase [Bryobacteraceae bacterium]